MTDKMSNYMEQKNLIKNKTILLNAKNTRNFPKKLIFFC